MHDTRKDRVDTSGSVLDTCGGGITAGRAVLDNGEDGIHGGALLTSGEDALRGANGSQGGTLNDRDFVHFCVLEGSLASLNEGGVVMATKGQTSFPCRERGSKKARNSGPQE